MTPTDTTIGRCPQCGESLTATWKLIEYEQADGSVGIFAECPVCEDVIKPITE